MIEIDQGIYVKVIFRNSIQAEGYVESWGNNEAVLLSADNRSRFVIFNIEQDVIGVKMCYEEQALAAAEQEFEKIVEEFSEVQQQPSATENRLAQMAILKTRMNAQEKTIIADRLRSRKLTPIQPPQYQLPRFQSNK
jgi:hypothetical protein